MEIITLLNKRDFSAPATLIATVDGRSVGRAVFYPNQACFIMFNKVTGENVEAINTVEVMEIFNAWFK